MPAPNLMRLDKPGATVHEQRNALVRAAMHGKSLEDLLEIAVNRLREVSEADRAGLWLAKEHRNAAVTGRVVEALPGPIPEQWKNLDISAPFLRAALESPEMLRGESGVGDVTLCVGPLVGMRSATWIPIRVQEVTIGLAVVAYARSSATMEPETLRQWLDETTLVVAHHCDRQQCELAAEEIRAQVQLSRAILCGVSTESIFPQIAHAARYYAQAEFVALGRAEIPSMLAEGWDGPEEWRNMLGQERFERMWRAVLREGREVVMGGENFPAELQTPFGHSRPLLGSVIAMPIEVRMQTAGVLIAGLPYSEDSSDRRAHLEAYALLAASALDGEKSRKVRAELVNSFERFVEESSEALLVLDEHGRVRNASPSANAILRLPPEREVGREIAPESGSGVGPVVGPGVMPMLGDFFSANARDALGRWLRQIARLGLETSLRTESPAIVPFEAALSDGSVMRLHLRAATPAFIRGKAAPDHEPTWWVLYMEDRTPAKSSAGAANHAEIELLGLMDSIDSGVLLLDAAGNIRMASHRLSQILGVDPNHLSRWGTLDGLIDDLVPRFSRPAQTAARWREQARQGDESRWDELEMVRPAHKVIERFARPLLNARAQRVGWLEVYRDITGHRLIQSKLLQTEKMAAVGQLVSGIAHELNNPLTSIQGYAQLLLTRRTSADRVADAERISQEATRAGGIVKNLLLFSRENRPERQAVDLNDVVESTLSLRAYQMNLENIQVDRHLDPALPQTLANAAQLQQVILNLLVNAEQSIQKNGAEQSIQKGGAEQSIQKGAGQKSAQKNVRRGRVGVRTMRLAGDRIALEISDDGPGIPGDVISRVFDPFFTTKPAGVGTGLGLSIVYGIVHAHGGEVSAESHPGGGATITVELPALNASAPNVAARPSRPEMPAASLKLRGPSYRKPLNRERILVLEDEPTVAQLVADVMSEEGHRVDILLDSREALGRLEQNIYELIICDLKMPHLDGPGFYRELVRSGNPLQHRLLFITGDTMSPRTQDFLTSSGLPYLAKPFLVEELKQVVYHALGELQSSEKQLARRHGPAAVVRGK